MEQGAASIPTRWVNTELKLSSSQTEIINSTKLKLSLTLLNIHFLTKPKLSPYRTKSGHAKFVTHKTGGAISGRIFSMEWSAESFSICSSADRAWGARHPLAVWHPLVTVAEQHGRCQRCGGSGVACSDGTCVPYACRVMTNRDGRRKDLSAGPSCPPVQVGHRAYQPFSYLICHGSRSLLSPFTQQAASGAELQVDCNLSHR